MVMLWDFLWDFDVTSGNLWESFGIMTIEGKGVKCHWRANCHGGLTVTGGANCHGGLTVMGDSLSWGTNGHGG